MRLHALLAIGAAIAGLAGVVCDPYGAEEAAGTAPSVDAGGGGDAGADTTSLADGDSESMPPPPIEIASVEPRAMAASGAAVVWLHGGSVFAHVASGPPVTVMTVEAPTGFLAIESPTAFVSASGSVRRCNVTSPCGTEPSAPVYGVVDVGPVAVANGELYVAERAGSRRLMTCGVAQSCGVGAPTMAVLPSAPFRMALGTAWVVLALDDKTVVAHSRAARLDAGTTAPLALGSVFDLRGLAGDGKDVYWTDGAGGTISRCTIDACAATTSVIASNRSFPRAIAVAGGKAYWAETDGDAVWKCSLPACADPTVVVRIPRPVDVAIGDRVYVASASAQKIYAVPR